MTLMVTGLEGLIVTIIFRHSATKGILVAMACTFFEAFNVPVFWPILVMYFIMLFCITMKRQIKVIWQEQRICDVRIYSIASNWPFRETLQGLNVLHTLILLEELH